MSDTSAFGFGKFVPGFDFLHNLAQSSQQSQPGAAAAMPNMASWVAPTLSIEELDKRIQELKAVQFWLDQNATALKATIQAMEVQKMTLSTLQGMNVNMADLAKAFTAVVPTPVTPAAPTTTEPRPEPAPEAAPVEPPAAAQAEASAAEAEAEAKPAVDPMQWWGALTEQFQNIAAAALKDVAAQALKDAPKNATKGAVKKASKKGSAQNAATSAATRSSSAAKKTATRRTPTKAAAQKGAAARKRA